jgi:hypothetical protein
MRTPNSIHRHVLGGLLLVLAACGTDSSSTADEDGTACVGADCGETGLQDVDDNDALDVAPLDASDVAQPDAGEDDADTTSDDTEACEGGFACPCVDDLDCDSGICIDTGDEQLCTEFCTGECTDPTWECRLIRGSGGDVVEICIPPADVLCRPCGADIDCGGLEDRCIDLQDGSYCGTACDTTDDCPTGAICQDLGGGERQCIPELGVCGGCLDEDQDRHGIGPECIASDCDDLDESVYEGAPESCDNIDNDCDDEIDEGFDLQTDVRHCGACGVVCAGANAEMACVDGACAVATCSEGFADCNLDPADGCEVDLLGSLDHCGSCDALCAPDNAVAECNAGVCEQTACLEPFADCDRDGAGCESDLLTSLDHCGACGDACAPPNGEGRCSDGICAINACAPGFADCDLAVDTGCEINVLANPANCGGCGNVCDLPNVAAHLCLDGGCGIAACDEGFEDCNRDPADGCEIRVLNDVGNCGACGTVCEVDGGAPACIEGVCGISSCEAPAEDCNLDPADGCEINLARDLNNCGFCDFACDNTNVSIQECRAGICEISACDAGFDDCNGQTSDGCEQDIDFDLDNCGACGSVCAFDNASASCTVGACAFEGCDPGFVDLDLSLANGCEYACTFLGADTPDDGFIDANCDGIDGDIPSSVFVRDGASPSNDGLTPNTPVPSLAQALTIAASSGRSFVLIAEGGYEEAPIVLTSAISIFGGYASDFRSRSNARALITSTGQTAITVRNLAVPARFDRVSFITLPQSTPGQETRTVVVSGSGSNLTLTNVRIRAGAGGDGTAGNNGSNGAAGNRGANASGSSGGGGASVGGGNGASGRRQASGPAGSSGSANGSSCGGSGGAGSGTGGLGCNDGNPRDGGNGGNGCNAPQGSSGAGGTGLGFVSGEDWSPSGGASGGTGGRGGGGGGGGAGGGEDCTAPFNVCLFCGTGRGGGGGGGGGAGGTPGTGGSGGGASIGMLLNGSTVNVVNVEIVTEGGGDGGPGGRGGAGGSGGSGGAGQSTSSDQEGDGGDGGDGGRGGDGGCGGGGGGGPSVGVWQLGRGAGLNQVGPLTFGVAAGGRGGSSCGVSGSNGIQSDVYP